MTERCPDCGRLVGEGSSSDGFCWRRGDKRCRTLLVANLRSRIAKLEAANARLVELCEEYEAQWGDDYLARKWGLKEALAETKAELGRGKADV